jgi:cytoskeletal protein RodZ
MPKGQLMTRTLSDFRIENEKVVLLSFVDGHRCRVNPADLHRYLSEPDLLKVEEALQLRKHFMKRILPPTVMALLVSAVIGVGGYDVYRMSNMVTHKDTSPEQQSLSTQPRSASAPPAQASTSTAAEQATAPAPAAARPSSVAATSIQSQAPSSSAVSSSSQPATSVAVPVGPTLTSIPAPLTSVTDTLKKVTSPLLLRPLLGK